MVFPRALEDFRVRAGVLGEKRPRLGPDAFTEPQGAFDAMPEGLNPLSPSVKKGLDSLSPQTRDAMRKYLSRDADPENPELGGEDQDPSLPATLSTGTGMPAPGSSDEGEEDGKLDRLCSILSELDIPDEKIQQLRQMLAAGRGDGDLLLKHEGDRRAFDNGVYSAGSAPGSEPPPFSGAPRAGGSMVPIKGTPADVNRRLARDMARQTKVLDNVGLVSRAADIPQERKPPAMAQDSASSLNAFLWRFPEAQRLFKDRW
jgi:hypothetical protein